nr:hypothetical protein Cplu_278 [Cedratvirus plubellavi]
MSNFNIASSSPCYSYPCVVAGNNNSFVKLSDRPGQVPVAYVNGQCAQGLPQGDFGNFVPCNNQGICPLDNKPCFNANTFY